MILITGASGFVGSALKQSLVSSSISFVEYNRSTNSSIFSDNTFNVVIHLAARVHVIHESAVNPMAEFRQSNVVETLSLAQRAVLAGVKRFIYVSSIGVNGDFTANNQSFTEHDTPRPHNAYAISKHEAELELFRLSAQTGLEVVVVRPPLVYGAGAPGNFGILLKYLSNGIPLPLGAVNNRRSMIFVGNLVDFLILCAQPSRSPQAANQTFLISDGHDMSTTSLLKTLAQAQGKPANLFAVDVSWLSFVLKLLGKTNLAKRLLGDLQIDSSKARTVLGWMPPFTVEQGLAASVQRNVR